MSKKCPNCGACPECGARPLYTPHAYPPYYQVTYSQSPGTSGVASTPPRVTNT